jgi:HK97 family phage major capsid protein
MILDPKAGKRAWNDRAAAMTAMRALSAKLGDRTEFTAEETVAFNRLKQQVSSADEIIERAQLQQNGERGMKTVTDWNLAPGTEAAPGVQMLSPDQKLSEVYRAGPEGKLSLGKMLRGAVTGRWDGAAAEQLAMRENANSTGGFLVPTGLWNQVLDRARAASVLIRAGMRTIPMDTETLLLPKVSGDPTFSAKGEGQAWTESDASFEANMLKAVTYGAIVRCSNELLADSPLAMETIENTLVRGLATAIDSACLIGSSGGITGLVNSAAITTAQTGSVGAIDWTDLVVAATAIRTGNFEPNAYIASPTIAGDLDLIVSGDGTNSARMWLGPPPAISGVTRQVTNTIGDATIVMGDFSYLAFGVRQEATIEVSRTADDAFHKNDTLIRIVWRGDSVPMRTEAFHKLAGITT